MLKILNRLAWFVSYTMGFLIIFIIGIAFDIIDDGYAFDDDTYFVWIMLVLISGFLFKRIFLSKSFISTHLGSRAVTKPEVVEDAGGFKAWSKENKEPKSSSESKALSLEDLYHEISNKKETVVSEKADIDSNKNFVALKDEIVKEEIQEQAPKNDEPGFIQKFFSENALAKIGGILLFLAVLFLLQLVYTVIGPIGKLMIGFLIGFMIFGIGFYIESKGYKKESRILFGTAILINYLVILSGRYLIGEELFADKTILNEGMTFFLLIVNTVFAVSVSMAFQSHALLFLSFVVAYFNPFLIGAKTSISFFSLPSYGLLVSLGAILLSYYYRNSHKKYSLNLLNVAFVGGNILLLFSPFETTIEWLIKLGLLAFLSLLCIFVVYKNKQTETIAQYFVGLYIFFAFLIVNGSLTLDLAFHSGVVMTGYLCFMLLMTIVCVSMFAITTVTSLYYILLAPLLVLIGLVYSSVLYAGDIGFVLIASILLYFMIFARIVPLVSSVMKYIFFAVLGGFIFLVSGFLSSVIHDSSMIDAGLNLQAYGVMIATFIFLISSYYFSSKKNLEHLYSLGTIFSIFTLLPVLDRAGDLRMVSIVSIVSLVILNVVAPFVIKRLVQSKIKNLILGLVSGVIFAVGEMFYFWYGDVDQSKMTIGVSVLLFAVLYFFISFLMTNLIRRYKKTEVIKNDVSSSDTIYALLGISLSLFSLSIAYIFSKSPEVISMIWLFESSILFYFYHRSKDFKVYVLALVLMFVGLLKLLNLLNVIEVSDYTSLISLFIIMGSFVVSLKFLESEKRDLRHFHDFGHVVGMIFLSLILFRIIPDHGLGLHIFGFAVFNVFLSVSYSMIFSGKIKYYFILFLLYVFMAQIFGLESFFHRAEVIDMSYLKIFQYLATALFALAFGLYVSLQKMFHEERQDKGFSYAILVISSLYLFVISSQYIFFLFNENEFILTIYWGLISFVFLNLGIQRDLLKLRTIGLYILSLTTIKILLYDIWTGLNDAILRVFALMLVGGIMIAISVLYSKKYGGDLKGEFSLNNLKK